LGERLVLLASERLEAAEEGVGEGIESDSHGRSGISPLRGG
jgi:hypothetical protein